jgi:copper resistance protein B
MGHCAPAPAESDGASAPEIVVAPPPPDALRGPDHAADTMWNPATMAASRRVLRSEHGDIQVGKVLVDRLEYAGRGGRDSYVWDAQAWWGGDIDKVWLKSEGEGSWGHRVERAEVQALWSHAIDPWFDIQAGVRHDFSAGPERTYFAVGVQGLAPYWFDVELAAFVSEKGEVSARAEAEHDIRLTQRLILQPRLELNLALQDVPERRIGAGLDSAELGLRLRYEIAPQFAPYVGLSFGRAFGGSARFRRADGDDVGGWNALLGIRAWF